MAAVEALRQPDLSSLSPRKIDYSSFSMRELIEIGEREVELEKKPTRLEAILLNKVVTEQALIDDSHADELGESMSTGRGQLAPIVVRTRLDLGGGILYDIIDGFHRAEGRKRKGGTEIEAKVLYGCSDEELFDQRILAASSVKSVQFPRIAEWITKSWETTHWSKMGLTVTQAFVKTIGDKEKTRGVKLTPEELTQLKEWVRAKCKSWQRGVSNTYQILRLVSDADPELVRQVRASGGGKDRQGKITPDRLKIVVERFPENYQAQRALLKIITERRYYAKEAQDLVDKAHHLILSGMTDEQEIYELASRISVKTVVSIENNGQVKKSRQGRLGLRQGVIRETSTAAVILSQSEEIKNLRVEIERLKRDLSESFWWRKADYLTVIEKVCIERILFGNQALSEVCNDLKITENQGLMLIRSAFSKRHERELERIPLLN